MGTTNNLDLLGPDVFRTLVLRGKPDATGQGLLRRIVSLGVQVEEALAVRVRHLTASRSWRDPVALGVLRGVAYRAVSRGNPVGDLQIHIRSHGFGAVDEILALACAAEAHTWDHMKELGIQKLCAFHSPWRQPDQKDWGSVITLSIIDGRCKLSALHPALHIHEFANLHWLVGFDPNR